MGEKLDMFELLTSKDLPRPPKAAKGRTDEISRIKTETTSTYDEFVDAFNRSEDAEGLPRALKRA